MSNLRAASSRLDSGSVGASGDRRALSRGHAVDRLVLDQVRVAAWDQLLFVECGDGWLVEEAWRRMGKGCVWGLSVFPHLVERAAQLRGIPGRIEFKAWGGDRFPLPDRSCDGVISCVPLVRYREPMAVLHEMARVLRPDGDAYLLEFELPTAQIPPAVPAADLRGMLVNTGLQEVGRSHCETALSAPEEPAAPVVIHARRCAPVA